MTKLACEFVQFGIAGSVMPPLFASTAKQHKEKQRRQVACRGAGMKHLTYTYTSGGAMV